ncbi:putative nucleic acid-binding protein, contains PIN domain [Methanophagales archaeon]|nr:putative nucleic acid-binding protein, contains PIN domain [Methanophagales archaeon]
MRIISDTDFLSSFLKIERLELVKDLFKEENLYIPIAVLGEIAKTDLITDLLDRKWIIVKRINYDDLREMESVETFKNLGSGEKECLVLCKQFRDSMLLISDNKAREIANKNNIAVLNISAFLLACKDVELLNSEDIATIIHDLKDKDYYEFSEEERSRLIV